MRDIERFSAKWDQIKLRPNSGQIMSDSFNDLQKHLTNIKTKRNEWQEVLQQKEKLMLVIIMFIKAAVSLNTINSNFQKRSRKIWS